MQLDYEKWETVYQRFISIAAKKYVKKINRLELCKNTSVCGWDSQQKSRHIKDKIALNLEIYLAVNECEMPVKFIIAEEKRANCKETINLIKNIDANLVFADCAYDTNILSYIAEQNMKSVIFPKRNRIEQRNKILRF